MDIDHDNNIRRYIHQQMTEAERQAFETEMQNDPELKEDVEIALNLMISYKMNREGGIRDKIAQVQQELEAEGFYEKLAKESKNSPQPEAPPVVRKWWQSTVFRVAASVSILLVVAWLLWYSPAYSRYAENQLQSVLSTDLYNQQPVSSSNFVGEDSTKSKAEIWQDFLKDTVFDRKKEVFLEQWIKSDTANAIACRFHLAYLHYRMGEKEKAYTEFEQLIRREEIRYQDGLNFSIRYYWALCLMSKQDEKKAQEELESLKKDLEQADDPDKVSNLRELVSDALKQF